MRKEAIVFRLLLNACDAGRERRRLRALSVRGRPARRCTRPPRTCSADWPSCSTPSAFLGNAATGDFGLSLRHGAPVAGLILERLPATAELAGASVLLSLLIGIPVGVATALHPKSPLSKLALGATLLGMSLPTFLTGILLIMALSVMTGLLPAFGRGETVTLGFWTTGLLTVDGLKHLVLPTLTLGLFQTALVVRLVRGEMLEVLRRDFIKFARARGLTRFRIAFAHAFRNASLPVISVSATAVRRNRRLFVVTSKPSSSGPA